jgi:hypothetical protein
MSASIGAIACAAYTSTPPRNSTDFLELAENCTFLDRKLWPAHLAEYVKDNCCQMPDEKRDGYRQKSAYGHLHEQRLRIGPQTKGLPHISTPEFYRF